MRLAHAVLIVMSFFGFGIPLSLLDPGFVANTTPPPTTLLDFYPAAMSLSSPSIEACTTANNCVLDCTATTSGGPWACVNGSGATVNVTQGTGADTVTTPWGTALKQVTDAKAPKLSTPSAFETFWTQPHTVVTFGYSTTQTSSIPFELAQFTGSPNGFRMRFNDNFCNWFNSAATPTSIAVTGSGLIPQASNGWNVMSCRKAGTGASSVYTARANGISSSSSAWPFDPGAPTGGNLFFGRDSVSSGIPLDGPLHRVRLYNAAISDARLAALEAAYQGGGLLAADGTTLIDHTSGAQVFYVDPLTGKAWPYGNGTAEVESTGIPVEERNDTEVGGAGNNWAADGLNVSSWTDVGTPIVTTNQASGPFSTWKNTAEADLIADDDAAAFEGKSANNSCDNAVDHDTASCWIAPGTSGTTTTKARIDWVVTGGGTATPSSCDFTLGAGFNRYSCPTVTSGTVTTLKGRVLVGNAASDTGSILVSQCQCDRQARAQTGLMADATSQGRDSYHIPTTATAAWHAAGVRNNGTLREVFTLNHDVPGDELSDAADSWFLEDMSNAGESDHRMTLFYEVAGSLNHQLCFRLEDADGDTTNVDICSSPNITFARNTQYVVRAQWKACDATHTDRWLYVDTCADAATCDATTLAASDTSCTLKNIADDTWGRMWLGNRFSNSFGLNGRIARLEVTTP
jgi:hypothetical protein